MQRILSIALVLVAFLGAASAGEVNVSPDQRPRPTNTQRPNTWGGRQYTKIKSLAVTSYTILDEDCGTLLSFTSGSAIALTVPATIGTPTQSCQVGVEQDGAGQITVSAGSGATLVSAHSYTKTFGQNAIIGLMTVNNSTGAAAKWNLNGDGA